MRENKIGFVEGSRKKENEGQGKDGENVAGITKGLC